MHDVQCIGTDKKLDIKSIVQLSQSIILNTLRCRYNDKIMRKKTMKNHEKKNKETHENSFETIFKTHKKIDN